MQKPSWRTLGLAGLTLLALSSCHKERVTPADLTWLPGTDGDALRFRNDTLSEQTVYLRRSKQVNTLPGKTGDNPYETVTLVYQTDGAARISLSVSSAFQYVTFARADSSGLGLYYTQLVGRDSVNAQGLLQAAVLRDTTVHGRFYRQLLRAERRPGQPAGTTPLAAFYYSPADGLVGYRTSQGRMWWRAY